MPFSKKHCLCKACRSATVKFSPETVRRSRHGKCHEFLVKFCCSCFPRKRSLKVPRIFHDKFHAIFRGQKRYAKELVRQRFSRTFGSTFWCDLPQNPCFIRKCPRIVQKNLWCCSCDVLGLGFFLALKEFHGVFHSADICP